MMRRSAIVCSGWAAAPQVRQKSGEDYPEVPPRAHGHQASRTPVRIQQQHTHTHIYRVKICGSPFHAHAESSALLVRMVIRSVA